MDTQRIIGADIIMAFDECPPGNSDYAYSKQSLGLTQRWLDRCIKRFNENGTFIWLLNKVFFLLYKGALTRI